MAYGSCVGNGIAWSQASAEQNTWYPVTDADIVDGVESGVANASGTMTVGTAGTYQIVYNIGVTSNLSRRVEATLYVNSEASEAGRGYCYDASTLSGATIAGTGILTFAQNDTLRVAVRTTDGGWPTLSCDHLHISVVQLT